MTTQTTFPERVHQVSSTYKSFFPNLSNQGTISFKLAPLQFYQDFYHLRMELINCLTLSTAKLNLMIPIKNIKHDVYFLNSFINSNNKIVYHIFQTIL